MTEQSIDLKQIERKVWMTFFEDGIWDIFLGLLLMAMAFGALLADTGAAEATQLIVYGCVTGGAFIFLFIGKRYITVPRIGHVNFGPMAKARKKKATLISALSVLVGIVVFILVSRVVHVPWLSSLPMDVVFPAIWVGNMLILFSLAAYFLEYRRLYLVGVMYAVAIPLDIVLRELTHFDLTFIAMGMPAALILIIGIIVLARFVKKYSIVDERTLDVSEKNE
jgi:hypothetical protein